jgi:perosamine synthetase
MTTSEGGMITTNDTELSSRLHMLRNHGQSQRYSYNMVGYNFRMTDVAASIGLVQLSKLEKFTEKRIQNAQKLNEGLEGLVEVPYVAPDVRHVYHQYTIKQNSRDGLKAALEAAGIGSGIYYPKPLHQFPVFESYKPEGFSTPIAEELAKEVLSLPVRPRPSLTDEEIDKVINAIKNFINQ